MLATIKLVTVAVVTTALAARRYVTARVNGNAAQAALEMVQLSRRLREIQKQIQRQAI